MANSDKNILITPNIGSTNDPKIELTGATVSASDTVTITAKYDTDHAKVEFSGTTGTLVEIHNDSTALEVTGNLSVSGSINSGGGGSVANTTGETGDGYITFFTGTSTLAGDNDLYWDRTNNRLGIGNSSPTSKLDVATPSGHAILGTSSGTSSDSGVKGISSDGRGVWGSSTAAQGIYGVSTNSYGVEGFSVSSYGVNGHSNDGYGIIGSGTYGGVIGIDTSGNGMGVVGESTYGYGVVAVSANTDPVKSSLRIVPQGSAPSDPDTGDVYVNESTGSMYCYNGSSWVAAGGGTSVTGDTGDGYITFFTGTSTLAGDNDFTWDRANNQFKVGPGFAVDAHDGVVYDRTGPLQLGTSSTTSHGLITGDVVVGGKLEVNRTSYFDGYGEFYVAVGDAGKLSYSYDGEAWSTPVDVFGGEAIYGIDNDGKGTWVIVGASGKIAYSTDGITWSTPRNVFGGTTIYAVKHDKCNTWVAVGAGGKSSYSNDGINWSPIKLLLRSRDITSVEYGNGTWVIGCNSTVLLGYSFDGIKWKESTLASAATTLYKITFDHGVWAAITNVGSNVVYISFNGIEWSAYSAVVTTTGQITTVASNGNDLWIYGSSSGYCCKTYNPQYASFVSTSNLTGSQINCIIHNGSDRWIIAGDAGKIAYSRDGVHWTGPVNILSGSIIRAISSLTSRNAGIISQGYHSNGPGVIGLGDGNNASGVHGVGDGYGAGITGIGGMLGGPGVLGSGSGIIGSGVKSIGSGLGTGLYSRGGDFGAPGAVAYGSGVSCIIAGASNGLLASYDGTTWTRVRPNNSNFVPYCITNGGNGTWVLGVVSSTNAVSFHYSDDGINWNLASGTFSSSGGSGKYVNKIAFNGKDRWIAVGRAGNTSIVYSTDNARTWSTMSNPFVTGDIKAVAHDQRGLWIIGGSTVGVVATSVDGIHWTTRKLPTNMAGSTVGAIAHDGNGRWVVAAGTRLATSTNGITWESLEVGGIFSSIIYDIVHDGKEQWVAVGDAVAISTNGLAWTKKASGFGTTWITSITHDGENYYACGGSGKIGKSPDALHWSMTTATGLTNYSEGIACSRRSNAGLIAHGSTYNGTGVQSFGHGNLAIGLESFGDGYGEGLKGVGGYQGGIGVVGHGGGNNLTNVKSYLAVMAPGVRGYGGPQSPGVDGYGGYNDGYGMSALGGAPNGTGMWGRGVGTGFGVTGDGGNSGGGGVLGRANADGTGVTGYGTLGYGVIAQSRTNSPTKSALRIVPQSAAPSSPLAGDVYVNESSGSAYVYNGSTWVATGSTGAVTSTGADGDGYIAFFAGDNLIAGDNDLYWNRTTNRLGIKTTTPELSLDVHGGIRTTADDGYIWYDEVDGWYGYGIEAYGHENVNSAGIYGEGRGAGDGGQFAGGPLAGNGIVSWSTSSGYGVLSYGGTTGIGVLGYGGTAGGAGVKGMGYTLGINADGVQGTGTGTYSGVDGQGGELNGNGITGWSGGASGHGVYGYSDSDAAGCGIKGECEGDGYAMFAHNLANGYGIVARALITSPVKSTLRLEPQASNPSSGFAGDIYVNRSNGILYQHNGTSWMPTVTSTGTQSDGYIAFFTSNGIVAGDNDLYFDRVNNKLVVSRIDASDQTNSIFTHFNSTDGYIETTSGSICLKPAVDDGYVDVHGDLRVFGQSYNVLTTEYIPSGTTQTIDWDAGNCQVLKLTLASGNVAVDLRNGQPGASYLLKIVQGANSRNVTWPSEVKWVGGFLPTITATANAVDVISLWCDGINYYCNYGQDYK